MERRTVGIAFVVLQGLSCQSVETFAPQESVAGLNRPPGVEGLVATRLGADLLASCVSYVLRKGRDHSRRLATITLPLIVQ